MCIVASFLFYFCICKYIYFPIYNNAFFYVITIYPYVNLILLYNLIFFNRHGDWVQFRIATDTRDQLKRATEIMLLPESFTVSGERREQGVIQSLKDGFGFIRCVEREPRLFFHFNEVLDVDREISVGDEVEFTVIQVSIL